MTKQFQLTLAFLLTLTAVTGCSGGRLRNLISRSDYKTLEEVEAEDTLTAEREAAADQKAFANAEKELSDSKGLLVSDESTAESEDVDAPEEKKSRFSLAGLFRRGDDSEEVTPDPFVAGGELAASEFEAVEDTDSEVKTASTDGAASEKTAQRVVKAEEQSVEDLFREKADEVESRATAELERAIAEMDEAGDDLPDSFSEYLKANRDNLEDTATEKATEIDSMFAEVEKDVTDEAKDAVKEFDSILNNIAEVETSNGDSGLDSELFPGLSDVVGGSTSEEAPAIQVTPKKKPEVASTATLFEEITSPEKNQRTIAGSDPFSQASEKHGFQKLTRNDPWAAFDDSSAEPPAKPVSEGLVWNDSQPAKSPTEHHGESFDWASLRAESTAAASGLSQVSSANYAEPQPEFSDELFPAEEDGAGLVIPVSTAPAPINFEESFPEFESIEDGSSAEPAFQSMPEESQSAEDATASASVEPTAAQRGRWSTRTWFLVIGCVLVVGMLLLPERKNRANA